METNNRAPWGITIFLCLLSFLVGYELRTSKPQESVQRYQMLPSLQSAESGGVFAVYVLDTLDGDLKLHTIINGEVLVKNMTIGKNQIEELVKKIGNAQK